MSQTKKGWTKQAKVYNVGWTTVESGRVHWKGVVLMQVDGFLFKHTCNHDHRKERRAWECAQSIGEKFL